MAVAIGSLVFPGFHLNQPWVSQVLPHLLVASTMWGVLAFAADSLLPAILCHVVTGIFNFSYSWPDVAGSFGGRRITKTGLDFGFGAWSSACAASFLLFIWAARRTLQARQAADLTPANSADNEPAPALIRELPPELRFLLGDRHYWDTTLQDQCAQRGRILVTTCNGMGHPYPHTDPGVEVRRTRSGHKTRSLAIENFNEQFKGIFDGHGPVPTRGLRATQRFALGLFSCIS